MQEESIATPARSLAQSLYAYALESHGSSRRCVFFGISELVVWDSNRRRFLAPFVSARTLSPLVDLFVFVGLTVSPSEELAIVSLEV
jgi:hypothetical protein